MKRKRKAVEIEFTCKVCTAVGHFWKTPKAEGHIVCCIFCGALYSGDILAVIGIERKTG